MVTHNINETITEILVTPELASQVLTHPIIILSLAVVFLLPILSLLILGIFRKGRSSNGAITSKPMISGTNFWMMISILLFIQGILIGLLIFLTPKLFDLVN